MNKTTLFQVGLRVVLLLSISINATSSTRLIKNGSSDHLIVLPNAPTPAEQRAAGILQSYLKKVSGAELDIVSEKSLIKKNQPALFIGNTSAAQQQFKNYRDTLALDGYRIVSKNNQLFLLGGIRNGVVYATTAFLEDVVGCRKFSAVAEYIPVKKNISIPVIDTTSMPAVNIRVVNGPMAEDAAVKDWRRVTTISDDWRENDWKGYYVHTFNRLIPPAVYFEKHPEYFGLINGERKPYAQLCLSNPEVLQKVIDTLQQEMAAHSSIKYWSVSPNDDFEYCRCSACAHIDSLEGNPTGLLLRFVNSIAKRFPDKTITTLAYSYTRHAPKITRPRSNVMITLCSIEMDRSESIQSSRSGTSFVEDLINWNGICNNLMIWDYEVQFTNYISPFPLFHTLQPNLQLFNRYGAKAHFQQCYVERGVEFAELKLYVLSKLLWNPDVNVNEIVQDFMKHYYSAAAPFVQNYFDRLHAEEIATGQSLDIYGTPASFANTLLSPELLSFYNNEFDRAEQAVKNDSVLLERVKIARLPLLFGEMEIAKTDLFGERGWFSRENGSFEIIPQKTALLDTFTTICRRNNIVPMNENGMTTEKYRASTLRFIDVSVEGNRAFEKTITCEPDADRRYYHKGPSLLTNGVRGTENYKINWLGWEGLDVVCTVDLESVQSLTSASISTLHFPQAWIIHPNSIACSISDDGISYTTIDTVASDSTLRKEPKIESYSFDLSGKRARYVRFTVDGTNTLPEWHTYVGNKSWVFIDELIVR
ncbi:MAG: hypothetical protein RIQ47_1442 [Bacteroidota bacterium]|jgi:hypothetical protein